MSLSIPESLKMCPKHGVAHGVCVDPIKAEVPPRPHEKPNAAHYGLEPETITTAFPDFYSCTLCGFTGSPKEYADHNCFANPDDVPNRFDPYEALDMIRSCAQEVEIDHTDVQEIMRQLYALRAYITGMEK